MTEEIINTDDYFYEITDEGRGTIGYGCVSYKTAELVRRIHKQNKQLKRLEQENKELLEARNHFMGVNLKYFNALEEIQKAIKSYDLTVDNGASVDTLYTIRKIINEVLQ